MLIAILMMIGAGVLIVGLRMLSQEHTRPSATAVYCPLHERVVEVLGDRCFDCDEQRFIGSIWACQRECRVEAEAKVREATGCARTRGNIRALTR